MAKFSSEKRKKPSFYEEKSFVGLTPGFCGQSYQTFFFVKRIFFPLFAIQFGSNLIISLCYKERKLNNKKIG